MSAILDDLLKKAVGVGASDLHLKIGLPPVVRVNGSLVLLSKSLAPLQPAEMFSICTQIVPENLKIRMAEGKEVDMAYSLKNVGRFRLNIFRHRGQTGIVARFIPFEIRSIEQLGLPPIIKKLALKERGLILITGNTGSGKSTTLAAMLNEWNQTKGGHIITIEDPIEYLIRDKKALISQREIGIDTADFQTGLKYALRQDPDVIMIGEMRDAETIQTALSAAETGHLVLSTLHTKDAVETVNRIVGVFKPEAQTQVRVQLSAALNAIISQRLLVGKENHQLVCACEVLVANPLVREYVRSPDKSEELLKLISESEQDGMCTFDQSLMDLMRDNRIDRETALAAATSPADFELRLRGITK